jgi:hypothetical protein
MRGCGGILAARSRHFLGISRQNVLVSLRLLSSASLAVGGSIMHWLSAPVADAATCAVLCVSKLNKIY